MGRWAIVRSGVVENVVAWDGKTETWQPPEGAVMVPATDDAEIGGQWNGTEFQRPVRIEVAPEPDKFERLLDRLVKAKTLTKAEAEELKSD